MSQTAADVPVCPSCGALGRPGAERCELCGTPYAASADAPVESEPCPACGHANPPGAAFCNRCGAALTEASAVGRPGAPGAPPPAAPSLTASSAPGRRALLVISAGLAVVVGLYAITLVSERGATPDRTEEEAVAPADPIPDGPTPALPEVNQRQADALEAEGTAEGWYEAGRFYLTAAFEARQTDPVASAQWARRAVADFERSLEIEPSADVQLAVAEASQFDPATPMRPVTELQSLLARYPDHVGANLMMGERRLQIGRLDSARASFERVVALTEPGTDYRARAEQALATVAAQSAGS